MSDPVAPCGECGGSLRWDGRDWRHLRYTIHPARLDIPEDPALAGMPVQWEWRDGQLVRLDNS